MAALHSSSRGLLTCRPRATPFSPITLALPPLGCSSLPSSSSCASSVLHSAAGAARLVPARRCMHVLTKATEDDRRASYNKEFGYSRKDIILIGVGLIALGYAMYYGLQAVGVEPGIAGNYVQLTVFLGICVGWVSTYLFRVATKQMTYVKQLEAYEDAVMKKRLEEMTEDELAELVKQTEQQKQQQQRRGGPQA